MAKFENVKCNQEVRVAVQEIVENASVFRQAKREFLVMVRTLLYYMSVCHNSENHREQRDSLDQNNGGGGEDTGVKGTDTAKNCVDIEKGTANIDKEEDDNISNETGCWSIEIIEEEDEEGTCFGLGVEDCLSTFIIVSMLVLVATLIVLFITNGGQKLKQ